MYNSIIKLIDKYSYPTPRYTSYPPLPNWVSPTNLIEEWCASIQTHYNTTEGLSIYIHLPFCEELCTYCGCNKRITTNHLLEKPYIQSILNEWYHYQEILKGRKLKIRDLHLGGGTPTFFSSNSLKELIDNLKSNADFSDAKMSFEAHPNSTTFHHLSTLKELGFDRISIGVQDISPKIMTAINRHQTVEQIKVVHQLSKELGYRSINYDLIYGLPFQNEKDIKNTLEFVSQNLPGRIAYYSYAHVPWKSASQSRYNDEDIPTGKEKNKLKTIGHDMLMSMGYMQIGFDHYALPTDSLYKAYHDRQLHRNFMGYTDNNSKILIGLGCSSISESPDMFVQNNKSVEGYSENIEINKSAIVIGHKSNILQQKVSYHINQLMCYLETIFDENNSEDKFIFSLASDSLKELVSDEIIIVDHRKIVVLKADLLRTICSTIDPIFHTTKSQKYSLSN